MDLYTLLDRLEKEFFYRLKRKKNWEAAEIEHEFNEATKNILVVTVNRIAKDAKEARERKGS